MHDPTNPPPEVPLSQRETVDLAVDEVVQDGHEQQDRPNQWKWVIDRNPLFLISGVFMLGGCFLVSGAIHAFDPAEVGEDTVVLLLIALLAVLNAYEFAVIWLGLALSRTQTLVRDTRHLLGLALLLIIDAAFVYNETSILKPEIGGAIAAVATALALIKAWWISRSLGIQPTRSAMFAVAFNLLLMYALPVIVRLMAHDGFLDQPMAMLVWCGLGLALAAYALPLRWVRYTSSDNPDHAQLQQLITGGLIMLPLISLIGHAVALLWVYENAFELSMLSPLLLALAVIIVRQHDRLGGTAASTKAAAIVVACAVVPCLPPAESLNVESLNYSWLAFSPLRGVLIVCPIVLAWAWWINKRSITGSIIVGLPWSLAALGHTPAAMIEHTSWLINAASRFLPRTQLQWGALAITAAFICLVFGGLISWWRMSQDQLQTTKQPDP